MAIASKQNLGDDQRVNTNNGGEKKKKKEKEDKSRKQSDDGGCDFPAKRTKCPGVRLVGGRIYDSENGKTCHQCRQKTMDFTASCKNHKKDKPCTIKFCHKCLLNRYGEKAEEIAVLEDWSCPKCRGICNCSFCMKKRGHQPTGILVHTAKATGFSSVSELLHNKGPENFGIDKIAKPVDSGPRKAVASNNEPAVALPTKLGKENCSSDSSLHFQPLPSRPAEKKLKKMKREVLKEIQDGNQDDGGLLKEASPIKPQISDESLKRMKDGNRNDGVLSKKNSLRKAPVVEKGLKDIQEGIKCDGILLKEANTKKPRISKEGLTEMHDGGKGDNGDIKKEVKTSGKVEAVLEKEKNLKTKVCKEVSSSLIICEEQRNSRPQKGALMLDGRKLDKDGTHPHIDVEASEVHQNDMMFQNENIDAYVPLPQSTELTTVAGIDLPPEDVGHALQFLEFCAAFEEILDLKKGEPEYVLRELIHGRRGRRGKYSPVVQFHIHLLSLIQMDLGEDSTVVNPKNGKNSWLQALKNCASTSQCELKELKLDWLDQEVDDYESLDCSKKLRLLTFLCDEVLCTAKIRSWIEDQNLKFVEKLKEAKERVLAAKHKEKLLKQKILDEMAKAIMAKNGAPLSISEHEAVVLEIKAEAAQAHAEMLKSKDMVPNVDKRRPDALRTEPILLDINGHAFWTLKGYSDSNVLLQDVGTWDAVGSGEKWFIFNVEQEKEVDKYIYSLRKRRLQSQKFNDAYSSRISVEDMAVQ